MIEDLNTGLLSMAIANHKPEEHYKDDTSEANVNAMGNYVKNHVTSWDVISFTQKFESILKNKIVHSDKEISRFRKPVDGKKEGMWLQSLLPVYREINYMDLTPELSKYGMASLQEFVTKLSPHVFHVFTPYDSLNNDCLIAASNLEQPIWLYKNWVTREYALLSQCKDLLETVEILSWKYFNTWTSVMCIDSFTCKEFEMSQDFIIFLLYFLEIVDVEIFCDVYCLFFKAQVQKDSWDEIFQKVRMKNIIDLKFKFDNMSIKSSIVLDRLYHKNRIELNSFLPIYGDNKEFMTITKVVSPTTLAVLLHNYMPQLDELQEKLQQFYNSKLEFFFVKEDDFLPFTECVVKHHDMYQRAMIANVKSKTHMVVDLTDLGYTVIVAKSEIMYLHSMFTQLPYLGFTLRLGHISGLIVDRETVMKFLIDKLKVLDMISIKPEVCKVDVTKRIVSVLLKVENENGNLVYLHQLMSERGLVTIDEKLCKFHSYGNCL